MGALNVMMRIQGARHSNLFSPTTGPGRCEPIYQNFSIFCPKDTEQVMRHTTHETLLGGSAAEDTTRHRTTYIHIHIHMRYSVAAAAAV